MYDLLVGECQTVRNNGVSVERGSTVSKQHCLLKKYIFFVFVFIKGLGSQLKGSEDVKKGVFQDEDPLLEEKATLPVSVHYCQVTKISLADAVHIYICGCTSELLRMLKYPM